MTGETPSPLDLLLEAFYYNDPLDDHGALKCYACGRQRPYHDDDCVIGRAVPALAQVEALAEAARLGYHWLDLNYGYLDPDGDPLLREFGSALRAALVPFAAHKDTSAETLRLARSEMDEQIRQVHEERGPLTRDWCEVCGKDSALAYRGWHDDGSPMLTCAECVPPDRENPND